MRRAALRVALFALAACGLSGTPSRAYTTPPPGGALAWGAGGALLADLPGTLALFDDPARLADSVGARGCEFAASRARLDELDALTRVRAGFGARHGALAAALGVESFGPPAWRAQRLVLALARVAGSAAFGAAWSERRVASPDGGAARGRTLDVAGTARLPAFAGRLSALGGARSLVAVGAAAALADPDWTAELALDLGAARAHVTRTRDLSGARSLPEVHGSIAVEVNCVASARIGAGTRL